MSKIEKLTSNSAFQRLWKFFFSLSLRKKNAALNNRYSQHTEKEKNSTKILLSLEIVPKNRHLLIFPQTQILIEKKRKYKKKRFLKIIDPFLCMGWKKEERNFKDYGDCNIGFCSCVPNDLPSLRALQFLLC